MKSLCKDCKYEKNCPTKDGDYAKVGKKVFSCSKFRFKTKKKTDDSTYYFILAGTKDFEETLKEKEIFTEKYCLLKIKMESKLGKSIKKEAKKQIGELK